MLMGNDLTIEPGLNYNSCGGFGVEFQVSPEQQCGLEEQGNREEEGSNEHGTEEVVPDSPELFRDLELVPFMLVTSMSVPEPSGASLSETVLQRRQETQEMQTRYAPAAHAKH